MDTRTRKTKDNGFAPAEQRDIDASIRLLERASAPLDRERRMAKAERRRVVRMRKGGATVVPALVAICERYGLVVPGVPFAELTAKVTHAERLVPLERAVALLLRDVGDAILVARGDAWSGASAAYAMLQGASLAEPAIATELAKVHPVFARPRVKRARS